VNRIPAVVSQRNHFTAADEFVDDALPRLPDMFKHQDFRVWLTRYTETVIKGVASYFGVAAQRGIEQTAALLCDPEFYATKRKRRAAFHAKMKEDRARQEWERIERQNCPTAEQIQQQVQWSEQSLTYHQNEVAKHEANLLRLRAIAPKNIRFVPKKIQ
jgi:hypothetical protein